MTLEMVSLPGFAPKWLLQDMNIINYPPSPQAIITHLWLSAYIPEII